MKIYSVYDPAFREYGCVVPYGCGEILNVLREKPCPEDSVLYVPTDPDLEALPQVQELVDTVCGIMPMQAGFTNGHCVYMNALEYHKSSEWNVSTEDIILFLARRQELSDDFKMDTETVKPFRLPAGVLVEIYATTLHYAPCQTSDAGYRCLVILPKGTNYPVEREGDFTGEDMLMTATNKWLIGHPEGGCDAGTYLGLSGENLRVTCQYEK